METLIFVWDTMCEAGEAFLILGGIGCMYAWTKFKEWRRP